MQAADVDIVQIKCRAWNCFCNWEFLDLWNLVWYSLNRGICWIFDAELSIIFESVHYTQFSASWKFLMTHIKSRICHMTNTSKIPSIQIFFSAPNNNLAPIKHKSRPASINYLFHSSISVNKKGKKKEKFRNFKAVSWLKNKSLTSEFILFTFIQFQFNSI